MVSCADTERVGDGGVPMVRGCGEILPVVSGQGGLLPAGNGVEGGLLLVVDGGVAVVAGVQVDCSSGVAGGGGGLRLVGGGLSRRPDPAGNPDGRIRAGGGVLAAPMAAGVAVQIGQAVAGVRPGDGAEGDLPHVVGGVAGQCVIAVGGVVLAGGAVGLVGAGALGLVGDTHGRLSSGIEGAIAERYLEEILLDFAANVAPSRQTINFKTAVPGIRGIFFNQVSTIIGRVEGIRRFLLLRPAGLRPMGPSCSKAAAGAGQCPAPAQP